MLLLRVPGEHLVQWFEIGHDLDGAAILTFPNPSHLLEVFTVPIPQIVTQDKTWLHKIISSDVGEDVSQRRSIDIMSLCS